MYINVNTHLATIIIYIDINDHLLQHFFFYFFKSYETSINKNTVTSTIKIRDSLMVRMGACRVPDRGSIPRRGDFFGYSCRYSSASLVQCNAPQNFCQTDN